MKLLLLSPILFILFSTFAIGQTFSLDIDVDDPPEGILSDEWAEMYINGVKVGYSHSILKRNGKTILTREESLIKVGRAETAITTQTSSTTRETIEGTPLSMVTITREAGRTKTQRIQFNSNQSVVSTNDGVRSWTREFTLSQGFVVSWGFVRELEKADLSPGESYSNELYVPDLVLGQTIPSTTTLIDIQLIDVDGEKRQISQFEQVLQIGFLPVKLNAWILEDGSLYKMVMPLGGIEITMIGSTEEAAKASFSPPDLFSDTLIPLNQRIPTDARSVLFLVKSGDNTSEIIPNSDHQTVREIEAGIYEVRVEKKLLKSGGDLEAPEIYLAPSPLVDFEDPAIIELISASDLQEMSFEDRVRELVRIADDTISVKSMDLGFATASETVALSEGDCTEHSLLLAALGRAAGIPTRGATGVVYFLTQTGSPVMGYHMWNQMWNGSEWQDVDAAFGTAEPDPVRILFGTSDLSDPSMAQEVLSFAQFLGQTEIQIISSE